MPPASAGSQPVAWMLEWSTHVDLFRSRSCAERVASRVAPVHPLYLHPQPAITDEEREAIVVACAYMDKLGNRNTSAQETLMALLARAK